MDQWTETTWPGRVDQPTLRVVSGHAVRVLPRPGERSGERPGEEPRLAEDDEPAGIRVLVVGDDVLARRGVLAALDGEPGMVVVGEHRNGPAVLTTLTARHPDVLLLHGLRAEDAAPVLAAVRRTGRTVRVLGIGMRDGEALPGPGACGSLPAWATPEEVVAAVRMAAAGFALSRAGECATGRLVRLPESRHVAVRDGLSERECDVLALVARGMSNAEIAGELTLSEHTVKSHMQNLLGKLGLRNRIHAVIYAFESGLAAHEHR
ncbi:MAG: DNA-binding response regulator [Actinophytocola sp.]|uniref:response regulator transcription factor n=1 Tax=Actinophytocola sp. TaxID=1872138 RepID=UPI001324DD40|nr:response regulator transcription factor [Actinophytocola sp.]MPZ82126.1 DNA-binding response regulator [Actinophytocola sp.]